MRLRHLSFCTNRNDTGRDDMTESKQIREEKRREERREGDWHDNVGHTTQCITFTQKRGREEVYLYVMIWFKLYLHKCCIKKYI